MIERHYTREQLEWLAERREQIGEEAIKEVEAEWTRLIAAVRERMDAGADPADPAVQKLAARWRELVAMFHGNNEGIREAVGRTWEETSPEEMKARLEAEAGPEAAAGIPDREVSEFIERAHAVAGEPG